MATTGTARLVLQSPPPLLLRLSPLPRLQQQAVPPHLELQDPPVLLLPKQPALPLPLVLASKALQLSFSVLLVLSSYRFAAFLAHCHLWDLKSHHSYLKKSALHRKEHLDGNTTDIWYLSL
jgi:hypothetical protein